MKKIIMIAVLATALVMGTSAQDKIKEKDVPAAIQTTFKNTFPDAKDVDWKMKGGMYKVSFEMNGVDQMAAFDDSGKMISSGMKIRKSDIPAAISSAVKNAYAGRNIDEVYKVMKDGSVNYLVKLNGNPETKVMYSADGTVVKE